MQKSFAGLMLGYLRGDAMNMASVVDTFGIKLTNVDEYARTGLRRPAQTQGRFRVSEAKAKAIRPPARKGAIWRDIGSALAASVRICCARRSGIGCAKIMLT